MELRHLRYFVAVAETLHFGKAAQRLHMAQPPLSQQIQALEAELGVMLFRRTKRMVCLTPAGSAFLAEAYRVLAQVEHAVQVAQRTAAGEWGRLRVGFVSSAAFSIMPEIVRAFRAAHPGIGLELRELTGDSQLASLQDEELDIGFYRIDRSMVGPDWGAGLKVEPILREPFRLALPATHPLAAMPELRLDQLRHEAMIMFPRHQSPSFYDQILGLCQQAGFIPAIAQEAALMQTIVSLVAAGLGVALVPASVAHLQRPGVVYRPLVEPQAYAELVAIWRQEDDSALLAKFIASVHEVLVADPAHLH